MRIADWFRRSFASLRSSRQRRGPEAPPIPRRPSDSGVSPGPPGVFPTFVAACREARKRRMTDLEVGLFTRVEPFRYGKGFVLRTIPIDMLAQFPPPPMLCPGMNDSLR